MSNDLDKLTAEFIERRNAYWRALGEFMDLFSGAELAIQVAAWHYSGMKENVARAVMSGLRVDAAINTINRIFVAEPPPAEQREDFGYVSQQLGIINGVRNMLIHHGILEPAGLSEEAISSKAVTNFTQEIAYSIPISARILDDLIFDLRKIRLHLVMRHFPGVYATFDHEADKAVLAASWRYKQPQQSSRPGKTRAQHPKRKRPRQPLQE